MLVKPNIYEADFEKFFDGVAHVGIRFVLKDFLHFPFTEVQFVNQLNESLVQLQEKDKIKERDRAVQLDKHGNPNPQADPEQNPQVVSGHAYLEYTSHPDRYKSIWEAEQAVRKGKGLLKEVDPSYPRKLYIPSTGEPYTKMNGVPQGAPTSCSTATLALRFLERKLDILFYADDVIYFPKSSTVDPIRDLSMPMYGLKVNKEKSR